MNGLPDQKLIEEAALIRGVNPSFVEKDWYVTQVICQVSAIQQEGFKLVFTGGTALSKAHKLISRFSEDIDFRVITTKLTGENPGRQKQILSGYKRKVFAELKSALMVDKLIAGNANKFFSCEINYPTLFPTSEALRPHILVEFTVADLAFPTKYLPVSSLINETAKKNAEASAIECIDPAESAADKLSAIVWRIPDRVRNSNKDDPDIVRHIHDLALLREQITNHAGFRQLAIATINNDDGRSSTIKGLPLAGKFEKMLNILKTDTEYGREYTRFVIGMSYASSDETPPFNLAVEYLEEIVKTILV